MAQIRTLKQVLSLLSTTAQRLHQTFHSTLCLLLQLHEAVQRQKQHVCAEAAVQAVQAALHAASMCATDDLKLAWMKLHVPTVSRAVAAYVTAQSEISVLRARILQQLMAAEGQQPSEQFPARWKAEADVLWQLFAAGRVAVFLAALATVMKALSGVFDVSSSGASSRPQHQGWVRSCQEADELLAQLEPELVVEHCRVLMPVTSIMHTLQSVGTALGLPWRTPDNEVGTLVRGALDLLLPVSLVWLELALSLPITHKHDGAQAWVEVVDWQAHIWDAKEQLVLYHKHGTTHFGQMLCRILAHPVLNTALVKDHLLHFVTFLLFANGLQLEHLGQVGVQQAVVQRLLQAQGEWPARARKVYAAQRRQVVSAVEAAGPCISDHQTGTPDHDNNYNDMHALLELMYGTLSTAG